MELVYYQCPICGFVYQVPEYWMDFSPEETLEMPHVQLGAQEACSELRLVRFKP